METKITIKWTKFLIYIGMMNGVIFSDLSERL